LLTAAEDDQLPTLGDFMSDAVKQSLMPKVRNDYRGRLSKLLKEPDAFRPQEFIYTKVTYYILCNINIMIRQIQFTKKIYI
jgi:hypothetical protein